MRVITQSQRLLFTLCYGAPLFAFAQTSSGTAQSPVNYQKAAEECIAQTEKTLQEKGVIPSEESSDYDTAFDVAYKKCMAEKGLAEEPINADSGEPSPPDATIE